MASFFGGGKKAFLLGVCFTTVPFLLRSMSVPSCKGGLVGLWAGDVLLFAPSAPPLKI